MQAAKFTSIHVLASYCAFLQGSPEYSAPDHTIIENSNGALPDHECFDIFLVLDPIPCFSTLIEHRSP